MEWINDHAGLIGVASMVLVAIANHMSEHWTVAGTPLRRVLLAISEVLSVLTSRGVDTSTRMAGAWKLPGSSVPPTDPSDMRSGVHDYRAPTLAIIMMLVPLASCATWQADTRTAATTAHATVQTAWSAARPVLHARCMRAAEACGKVGGTIDTCPDWARCNRVRHTVVAAVVATEALVVEALLVAESGKKERVAQVVASLAASTQAVMQLITEVRE